MKNQSRKRNSRTVKQPDAQTAALDIEKQQAVVDALAALAENGGVLESGIGGYGGDATLEPGGTVTEAPVAALAPGGRRHDGDIHAGLGKSGKLRMGAALTLRQGGNGCQHHGAGHLRAG